MATSNNKPAKSPGNVSDTPGALVQHSYAEQQGAGGETHQVAGGEVATLTTAQGGPIADNFFADTDQVAFCTQNVPPGVDFSNDPLLQGRNFSYLDTQLKRLGSPNFTHIPINAPKCPFAHFQQDGHMAMRNPVGRANYEALGAQPRLGPFVAHYSQARQFFVSQTPIEQKHIGDALVFELSKCERPDIRSRVVSHLVHIDADLAATVADGLGLELPEPARTARPVVDDLPPADALSIVKNGPESFADRKLGILITDGADAALFNALVATIEEEKAVYEVIAPKIGGATLSDGTKVPADQKIDGGPSVLYDAVAMIASEGGAALLAGDATAKDFVTDAFAHSKFIGYSSETMPLFEKAGLAGDLDEACIELGAKGDAASFVEACRALRFWNREANVVLDAKG